MHTDRHRYKEPQQTQAWSLVQVSAKPAHNNSSHYWEPTKFQSLRIMLPAKAFHASLLSKFFPRCESPFNCKDEHTSLRCGNLQHGRTCSSDRLIGIVRTTLHLGFGLCFAACALRSATGHKRCATACADADQSSDDESALRMDFQIASVAFLLYIINMGTSSIGRNLPIVNRTYTMEW